MSKVEASAVERIIANTINETAQGDPDALAVTDIDLGAFLSGPGSPEHEALLRLIGASIFNPQGAKADDEPLAVNTGREWSDAEMNALGEMLVRGVSMDEIARRLRRDHGDVRDKVVELGRECG